MLPSTNLKQAVKAGTLTPTQAKNQLQQRLGLAVASRTLTWKWLTRLEQNPSLRKASP